MRTRSHRRVVYLAVATVLLAHQARAQGPPRATFEAQVGSMAFPDDGVVHERLIGAALRVHLTPRLSIGPELLHVAGRGHSHLILTGNLTYDLRRRTGQGAPRLVPFLVAGGGMYSTRESFFPRADFVSFEGAFTAGGGLRAELGNRLVAGVDVRMGWEPHVRVNGLVGWRLP